MKQFFDTLSVFIGSLLRLKPVGWNDAKKTAADMRKLVDNFIPAQIVTDGEEVKVQRPVSPFEYLVDSLGAALGFVFVLWIISKLVIGFIAALPYLLITALIIVITMVIIDVFNGKEAPATAS